MFEGKATADGSLDIPIETTRDTYTWLYYILSNWEWVAEKRVSTCVVDPGASYPEAVISSYICLGYFIASQKNLTNIEVLNFTHLYPLFKFQVEVLTN
jgi:hypothetical protein